MPPVQFGLVIPAGSPTREGRATFVADLNRALHLIAGHFDTASAGPGAFFALPRAHRGQRVHVATADGEVRTYRVVWVRSYPKSALPTAVFATHGSPRLVLVTCGGRFDSTSRHYLDNIVVTAVPV